MCYQCYRRFMTSIGVRELRQNASVFLARVRNGETIEVTDRGVPVALLTPVPTDPLARLVAAGELGPAARAGAWRDLVPLPLEPGRPTPSEVLAQLRDAEDR